MKRLAIALAVVFAAASASAQTATPETPVRPPEPPSEIIAAWGSRPFVDSQFGFYGRRSGVVRVGSDYALKADDNVRDVLVIGANAKIEGRVDRDVVVILGQTEIASTAQIDGSLVIIGGSANVISGAQVHRELVVVGGALTAPIDFVPEGDHVVIDTRALGGQLEHLIAWITRGLLLGRPIVPSLPWVWGVVAVVFFIYLLFSVLFEKPVRQTAEVLVERPVSSFVVGLLVLLLTGPICVLLAVSIIGIAVVPVVLCALVAAWVVGKIGATRWIGTSVIGTSDAESRGRAVLVFVVGFAVICLAYMVPVLGLMTWAIVGVFGLGSSTLAFLSAYRRENPLPVATPKMQPALEVAGASPFPDGGSMNMNADIGAMPLASPAPQMATPAPAMASAAIPASAFPANTSDLALYPRASFRDRLAAGVLDTILIIFVWQFLDPIARDNAIFLLLLGYYIGFWTWKGTTVGGIILQLRVIRVDGSPLRFVDALVRGLSSIFSLVVIGIGFLWILRDPERQAWQDRIAGTYVVKVPRNYPI